jgi:hypothetical protein
MSPTLPSCPPSHFLVRWPKQLFKRFLYCRREQRKRQHQEKRRTLEKIRIRDNIVRNYRVENRLPSHGKDGTLVLDCDTVTIQDADSLETVAIAKFTPLREMRERAEYEDIEALTT